MKEGWTLSFSQREGDEPLPAPLQLKELPGKARTAIWNVLYGYMEDSTETLVYRNTLLVKVSGSWEEILRDVYAHHYNEPLDEWSNDFKKVVPWIRDRLENDPFNHIFDLIEFLMRHKDCPPKLTTDLSRAFRRFQLAYIIDTGPPPTIFPATTTEESCELKRSLAELRTAGLDGCATHLRSASKCINDGDAAGSVRESIHAVESVAKRIAPKANTLSAALSVLEKQGVLHHKELASALGKLYNYTSDEDGIRHALLAAEANVTQDEALFMLGACASFASYLWRKHKAATTP